jgi:hypothetical protein
VKRRVARKEACDTDGGVVSQNFSPSLNETVLDGTGPNTILAWTQREYFGEQERCSRVQHTFIKDGRKVDLQPAVDKQSSRFEHQCLTQLGRDRR